MFCPTASVEHDWQSIGGMVVHQVNFVERYRSPCGLNHAQPVSISVTGVMSQKPDQVRLREDL